jgi:hypothetical protein
MHHLKNCRDNQNQVYSAHLPLSWNFGGRHARARRTDLAGRVATSPSIRRRAATGPWPFSIAVWRDSQVWPVAGMLHGPDIFG